MNKENNETIDLGIYDRGRSTFNTITICGTEYTRQGEFWNYSWSTTQDAVAMYKDEFYIDENDIVRWNSNDREPFGDMLLDFEEAGLIKLKHVFRTCESRDKATEAFWATHDISEFITKRAGE